MSHFSMLVITKSPEDLEAALQPFHEFECTGINDQYVKDIDDTEELRKEYGDEPAAGFAEWAAEYTGRPIVLSSKMGKEKGEYGYILVEGEKVTCIDRTNPDRKWDWWQLGGRFSGLLRVKSGAAARTGEAGVFGTRSDTGVDQCTARDLDYDAMAAAARRRSLGYVEQALSGLAAKGISRDIALQRFREYVRVRPLMFAAFEATDRKVPFYEWWKTAKGDFADTFRETADVGEALSGMMGAGVPDTEADPIAWANSRPALSVFGVLKDGKWYERGSMGWWGMVADEKDRSAWQAELANLLQGLPEDATISIVDCHI